MSLPHDFQTNLARHVIVSPPSSDNEQPSLFAYRLTELKELPRRLFRSSKPSTSTSQRIGRVRSFRLTPVYSVRLEDVLSGRHLPPLTLHDFESYLVHTERSSENLYFILWFNDYTKQYQDWNRSSTNPQHSPSLAYSYSRAKQTFFTKSAMLELNINAEALAGLSTANPRAHPPPSSFAGVLHEVEGMLTESLHNFVRSRSSNAGRNRGLFAIFVGLLVMILGLAPILSSVLLSKSRWLRVAAMPCFWFGATTIICGLHGVCIIIFLFGDARQLTAYELARPEIHHETLHYINTSPGPHSPLPYISSFSSKVAGDVEVFGSLSKTSKTPNVTCPIVKIAKFDVAPPDLHCDTDISPFQECSSHALSSSPASSDLHSPATIAPFLLTPPPQECSTGGRFDFDQLMSTQPGMSRSPPVFGPLTKVLDQICIRTYWETVTRSAGLAFVIAFILVMIAVAA